MSMSMSRPGPHARQARFGGRTWLLAGALSALVLTACESLRVSSDFDHTASFAGYHSFGWMPRQHATTNALVIQRIHDSIQAELIRKGYTYSDNPATADFVVDFTVGSRDRVDVQSYPPAYRNPTWGAGGWGNPYWGASVDVRQYTEGVLSIDIFDQHSHRPVWTGRAKKDLTPSDIQNSEAPIRAAVAAILEKFPPH